MITLPVILQGLLGAIMVGAAVIIVIKALR